MTDDIFEVRPHIHAHDPRHSRFIDLRSDEESWDDVEKNVADYEALVDAGLENLANMFYGEELGPVQFSDADSGTDSDSDSSTDTEDELEERRLLALHAESLKVGI